MNTTLDATPEGLAPLLSRHKVIGMPRDRARQTMGQVLATVRKEKQIPFFVPTYERVATVRHCIGLICVVLALCAIASIMHTPMVYFGTASTIAFLVWLILGVLRDELPRWVTPQGYEADLMQNLGNRFSSFRDDLQNLGFRYRIWVQRDTGNLIVEITAESPANPYTDPFVWVAWNFDPTQSV